MIVRPGDKVMRKPEYVTGTHTHPDHSTPLYSSDPIEGYVDYVHDNGTFEIADYKLVLPCWAYEKA